MRTVEIFKNAGSWTVEVNGHKWFRLRCPNDTRLDEVIGLVKADYPDSKVIAKGVEV